MLARNGSQQLFNALQKVAEGKDFVSNLFKRTLPGGVIGNTAEFGSAFPGSSPGWAAMRRTDA